MQELLAPKRIKFFNKHGMPLTGGQNDESRESIWRFWREPLVFPVKTYTKCILMSTGRWMNGLLRAVGRTTRIEDVAYSILQIHEGHDEGQFPIYL